LIEFESPEIDGRKVYDFGSKRNTTRTAHSNSVLTKTLQHEYQVFSVVDEPENYGEWWGIYQCCWWIRCEEHLDEKQSLECATLA